MSDFPRRNVFRGSRSKAAKLVLIFLGMEAVFAFDLKAGQGLGLIWSGLVLFAVLGLLALYTVVFPPELSLDENGLQWRGLRSWRVSWADVERFDLHRVKRSSSVVIRYRLGLSPAKGRRPAAIGNVLWIDPAELTGLLNGRLAEARAANPALYSPPDQEALPVLLPTVARPWLSLALIAVLAIVFAAEVQWPATPATAPLTPSTITLTAFGALGRFLLASPVEWYRFATAPFLHGSLGHLIANCFALFLAGRLLEGVIGRGWYAATYVAGALAGACGSLLLNPANTVTVGASGAIVGLFAAAFVCSFHFPRFEGRQGLQTRAISVLLPTLLTFGKTSGGLHIDFGAHLGGAIGGAVAGAALLLIWRKPAARPPFQVVGTVIASVGLAATILAIWPAWMQRGIYAQAAVLVPPSVMPENDETVIAQAPELISRFPDDPRLHLANALGHIGKNDPAGAEAEARIGLHDLDAVRSLLKPSVEAALWIVLGESLMERGMNTDAASDFDKAASITPQLAALDLDQAQVRLSLGRLDDALTAADQATERLPREAKAWKLLGDIRFARTEAGEALKAYQRENDLAPGPSPVRLRGLMRFYTGDAEGAVADLKEASQTGSQSLYWALWLDFVSERGGKAPTLTPALAPDADQRWPAQIVRFFLGGSTRDDLLRAAATADPSPGPRQVCEADFYLSEWDLMHGRRRDAEDGFKKSVGECPADFVETWMARAELAGGAPDGL